MSQMSTMLEKVMTTLRTPGETRKFLTGAGSVFILQIIGVAAAFAMQAFLARMMTQKAFGDYSFAYNQARLLAYFGTVGLTLSVLKFIPDYLASKDWARLRGTIRAFSIITVAASSVLAIAAIIIFAIFPPSDVDQLTLNIGLLLTPLIALTALYVEMLRSMGSIVKAYGPLNVGQNVLMIVFAGAFTIVSGGLMNVQAITLLGLVLLLIAIYQIVMILRGLPPMSRGVKPAYDIGTWVRVSLPMLLIRGFQVIMERVDIVVIGFMLGAVEVGIYNVASRGANLLSFSLSAVSAITAPRMSPLYNEGRLEELERIVKRAALFSLAISGMFFLGLLIFSTFLLSIFGEVYIIGRNTMMILAVGQLVNAFAGQGGYLLHLTGHQNISGRIYFVSMVMNIVLNIVLIPIYGYEGAALGTAFTAIVQNVWIYIEIRRRLGINPLPLPFG
ncbi:MAG: oligosaccharide flippase family protein [Anaerolineae bacterium]|nr:oligosaccharide flippase family protein [Anaerolineae bacterium]